MEAEKNNQNGVTYVCVVDPTLSGWQDNCSPGLFGHMRGCLFLVSNFTKFKVEKKGKIFSRIQIESTITLGNLACNFLRKVLRFTFQMFQ